jgi:hypothetical protein
MELEAGEHVGWTWTLYCTRTRKKYIMKNIDSFISADHVRRRLRLTVQQQRHVGALLPVGWPLSAQRPNLHEQMREDHLHMCWLLNRQDVSLKAKQSPINFPSNSHPSLTVPINNQCPECAEDHVDLSEAAFLWLEPQGGTVGVATDATITYIECA